MNDPIYQAKLQVEALLKQGAANVRAGKPGILAPGSAIGEEFQVAYDTWMNLQAKAGNQRALSMGYGHTHV